MEILLKAISPSKEETTNAIAAAITASKKETTNAITAAIAASMEETNTAIAAVKDDVAAMKNDIAASREETIAAIAAVKDDVTVMKDDITASREETSAAITAVKEDISAVDVRLDEKILSVEESFQKQMAQLRKEVAETTFAPAQNVFSSNATKPIVKLSTFDRKTGWSVYKTQLEMVASANGWNDATCAIHLAASLRGETADILQTLPAEKRNSLQDLLKALRLRFGDSALRDYHRLQLKTRTQKNAESLQELAADIERLSLTAYPDCPP